MRLWSIHPKYLDQKGLVACWREALLAKKVLQGKTVGYRNHPQLIRFRQSKEPFKAVNTYLAGLYVESCRRGYCFDKRKIGKTCRMKLSVTTGQLEHEFRHLLAKLKQRDPDRYAALRSTKKIEPHPLFLAKKGLLEPWERV
ncbi:pyrimidine dimer DNA glycosylase/endonuclease V [Candidatus Woesearchaeota archaeon]|nr:pyrimidine dimer DNA glycosylase/endonuclease V [Candidatus Woesearchaeota archaeon]